MPAADISPTSGCADSGSGGPTARRRLPLPTTPHRDARHRSAVEGLTVNLLSPVIPTFYLAAVPTFIRPTWPRGAYVVLAVCHVAMAFACHSSWVLGLHWMRRVFQKPAPRRALGLATAVALLWLAARVLGD